MEPEVWIVMDYVCRVLIHSLLGPSSAVHLKETADRELVNALCAEQLPKRTKFESWHRHFHHRL